MARLADPLGSVSPIIPLPHARTESRDRDPARVWFPESARRAHMLPVAQMGSAGPYPLEHLPGDRSRTFRFGLGSSHAAHSGTLYCDLSAYGASRPMGLAYTLLA